MAKTIKTNQLTPDTVYLVRGKVVFSRLSRHTTDAEREKENVRRTYKITSNYTNITIDNAQVICKNPQAPTIEERYAAECLYKSSNSTTANFAAMNKSKNLPKIAVAAGNNEYNEIVLESGHELATGLDVTVVMRVFGGEGGNNGVSLDRVLVNEPIRYFTNTSEVDRTLKEFGITFNAMSPQSPTVAPVSDADVAAPATAPEVQQAAPAVEAAAPVTDNPFSTYSSTPVAGIQFGAGDRQY